MNWTEQTVFAGEDVECIITFKNTAVAPTPVRTSLHPSSAKGFGPGSQRKPLVSQAQREADSLPGNHSTPGRSHRSTLSLNGPTVSLRSQPTSTPWGGHSSKPSGPHKRSVSIISIGASEGGTDDVASHGSFADRPKGPSRGHGRSASLQIIPRRQGVNGGPISGNSPIQTLCT